MIDVLISLAMALFGLYILYCGFSLGTKVILFGINSYVENQMRMGMACCCFVFGLSVIGCGLYHFILTVKIVLVVFGLID